MERRLQLRAAMLGASSRPLVATFFMLACSHSPQPPKAPQPEALGATADGYTIIRPDVSTNAPRHPAKPPSALDPGEDAMASILAIPPGR